MYTASTDDNDHPLELTLRALVLGIFLTLIFTAANVYFGLKAGLTFSTSIPAAVISMALLRGRRNASIQENNIVQTVTSAAGTLSSIIFVLPGLIMIGWWQGFPFWTTFAICSIGGILGVMYSVPLRRALVTQSPLPYPEGLACAEVLKVGMLEDTGARENRLGLWAIIWGGVVSAAFNLGTALKVVAGDLSVYFRVGSHGGASGFTFNLSFALLAIGHLVGLSVGLAMLLGAVIGWGWGVPHFSALHVMGNSAMDAAQQAWSHEVRFVGAGAIGVASIWALVKLVGPVWRGLLTALPSARRDQADDGGNLPRVERDIPLGTVGIVTLLCLALVTFLINDFSTQTLLDNRINELVIGGVVYVMLMGFFVATVCGYMAGIIGSSNSPLSGLCILVVIGAALLLLQLIHGVLPPGAAKPLVAFALLVTSVACTVATISNDNLQDLKTGHLVGATPWKQQVALMVGVLAGSTVIAPVLNMLNKAYGFIGTPGVNMSQALPAPQAGLISALAQGVIGNQIDWHLILTGAGIGLAIIVADEVLGITRLRWRIPPLAVGLGIYLPTQTTLMIAVGAVVGAYFNHYADRQPQPDRLKQRGVLLASGLIVGESLIGVLLAAVVGLSGHPDALAVVGPGFANASQWLGVVGFIVLGFLLYRWIARSDHH